MNNKTRFHLPSQKRTFPGSVLISFLRLSILWAYLREMLLRAHYFTQSVAARLRPADTVMKLFSPVASARLCEILSDLGGKCFLNLINRRVSEVLRRGTQRRPCG